MSLAKQIRRSRVLQFLTFEDASFLRTLLEEGENDLKQWVLQVLFSRTLEVVYFKGPIDQEIYKVFQERAALFWFEAPCLQRISFEGEDDLQNDVQKDRRGAVERVCLKRTHFMTFLFVPNGVIGTFFLRSFSTPQRIDPSASIPKAKARLGTKLIESFSKQFLVGSQEPLMQSLLQGTWQDFRVELLRDGHGSLHLSTNWKMFAFCFMLEE